MENLPLKQQRGWLVQKKKERETIEQLQLEREKCRIWRSQPIEGSML